MPVERCTFCAEAATYRKAAPKGKLLTGQRKVPFCSWHLLLLYLATAVYP